MSKCSIRSSWYCTDPECLTHNDAARLRAVVAAQERVIEAGAGYTAAADKELKAVRSALVRACIIEPELMMLAGDVKVARDGVDEARAALERLKEKA